MARRTRFPARRSLSPPFAIAELGMASWEVMWRRSMMMAQGACSAAEYQRMIFEKWTAWQLSSAAFWQGKNASALVSPYLTRARGNAKRLRRKRR